MEKRLGVGLKLGRTVKGWSQRRTAQEANISSLSRLWRIENCVSSPRPDELARLMQVLFSEDAPAGPNVARR